MLTLGRLIVAVIGVATVVLFGFGASAALTNRFMGPTVAALFAVAFLSLAGLALLWGRRGERESWIGAALIGVGPALGAGLGLWAAVESTLAGSFRPEAWLGATLVYGAATAVCIGVAVALRRLPTPTQAT